MNEKNNNSQVNLITRFVETIYEFIVVVFENVFENVLSL